MKTFKKLSILLVVVLLSVLASCRRPNNDPKLEEVAFSNMVTSMTKVMYLKLNILFKKM